MSGEPAPLVSGADIRTFLFADMRGYTRFTQEHGDDAASALAGRFADLVKETVPEFEGELLELRGDEALCVFRSARQALRASVELQRRLRTGTDAQPAFPIGVGMGLDAGEAVPTHGGYRGASLNLAARLCTLAKPGQILASETVTRVASRVDGIRFLEGRSASLKGMSRPVRYVVVEPEQLLPSVPPLPSGVRATRRRLWIAAAALLLIVVVALVAGLIRSGTHAVIFRPNTVVELDPSNLHVTRQVVSQGVPAAMVFGGGALWAAEASSGQVERVDPAGGNAVALPVGTEPSALAFGFGALWVANAGDGTVSRISPAAGNAPVGSPIRVGNDPAALVAATNGVWVASGLDDTVQRIDPLGHPRQTIQLSSAPTALTALGSAIWVAEPSAGSVVRIDARSGETTGSIPIPGGPVALSAGDGRVWIASSDGTLTGVDPTTAVPRVMWTVQVGRSPSGLAVAGGSAWVGSSTDDGLTQVTPSGHVVKTVRVGTPIGVITAAGNGGLWVAALPTVAAHRGGTLVGAVISLGSQNPDPVQTIDALDASMVQLTNDGLVALRKVSGSGGYELVPDLAAALPQPIDGGRSYTFELRRGIKYSTGAVVKASDVRSSMERVLTSNYAGAEGLVVGIVGAKACIPPPLANGNPAPPLRHCDLSRGIQVNNQSGTVTFHLTAPDPNFLAKLSVIGLAIVPAATPRDATTGHVRVAATGPYVITQDNVNYTTGNGEIVLTRNPYFHVWSTAAQPPGFPDRIVYRAKHDTQPRGNAADWVDVETGKADWTADQLPTDQLPMLISRDASRLHLISQDSTQYLTIDETSPPFNNVLARQAVNYAINRQRLLDSFGGKYAGIVTCQFLPPSFPGYQPYCPYTVNAAPGASWTGPDIAKAKALVRKSGTAGDRVVVGGGGSSDPIQSALTQTLQKIGYHVVARVFPQTPNGGNALARWLGNPSRPPHIANSFGWIADYPAAYDFLRLFTCGNRPSQFNLAATFYCNHAYDRRVQTALQVQQANPAAANRLWASADHYITDQAATVPLWNLVTTVLVSKRVGNVQYTPAGTGLPLIDQMWVK
jgi:ABC-type transport system substrate-binding protein/class 3 adenylate cyclase